VALRLENFLFKQFSVLHPIVPIVFCCCGSVGGAGGCGLVH
jgi:hypothetical protein